MAIQEIATSIPNLATMSLARPPSDKAAPPLPLATPKQLLMLRTGLMFGSEFFVDTQLPGPRHLKYTAVRVLPPSPLRHVTHAAPFAV